MTMGDGTTLLWLVLNEYEVCNLYGLLITMNLVEAWV